MARFFDPPQAKPLLPAEKIDKVFKSMRFKVFMGSFLGYAAYYLVRKNLSLASADMIAEGLIDKQGVGIAASAVSIAYAFSKFIMGTLSDRSDARKFLTVGLVIASLVIFVGAGLSADLLWGIADITMGGMTLINMPVILFLGKYAVRTLTNYEKQLKTGGEITFKSKDIDLPHETDYWN